MIVADEVAHQDIENIIIDGDGFAKARHEGKLPLYR